MQSSLHGWCEQIGMMTFSMFPQQKEYNLNSWTKRFDDKVFHAQVTAQPMTRDEHAGLLQLVLPLTQQLLRTSSARM